MTDSPWDETVDDSTILTEDDKVGLRPTWVATRGDLNLAEAENIEAGLPRRAPTTEQLLDDRYLRNLHRDLFGDVWTWAGTNRTRLTNIGIAAGDIGPALKTLVGDTATWIEFNVFEPDGILARFHHRLVWIHPFPNGNGRFARIATDLLAAGIDRDPFTWGLGLDVDTEALRLRYRQALLAADRDFDDVAALIAFARA